MTNKLLRHVHYVTSLDKHVQNYAYFWLEIYIYTICTYETVSHISFGIIILLLHRFDILLETASPLL